MMRYQQLHLMLQLVCTPTSFHLTSLKALLEAKVPNIYIEKPVSHSFEGIDELAAISYNLSQQYCSWLRSAFRPGNAKSKRTT